MRTLQRVLGTAAALALFVAPVQAGGDLGGDPGLSLKDAPAPAVGRCAGGKFAGAYIGGHLGYANVYDDTGNRDRFHYYNDVSTQEDGASYGIYGGYNMQCGNAVLGIEGDWSWVNADARETLSATWNDGTNTWDAYGTFATSIDSFGTLRGRAGIVADDMLLYLTAGLAFARIEQSYVGSYTNGSITEVNAFSFDDTRWGLAFGGGVELARFDRFLLRAEGLYVKFEEASNSYTYDGKEYNFDHEDHLIVARVGFAYKFGGRDMVEPEPFK